MGHKNPFRCNSSATKTRRHREGSASLSPHSSRQAVRAIDPPDGSACRVFEIHLLQIAGIPVIAEFQTGPGEELLNLSFLDANCVAWASSLDILVIQSLLGHSFPRSTEPYIHPSMKKIREAIERLPAVIYMSQLQPPKGGGFSMSTTSRLKLLSFVQDLEVPFRKGGFNRAPENPPRPPFRN